VADVLLFGDTERNPALRHEVPVAIGDPFLYAEVAGTVYIVASDLERDRIAAVRPDAVLLEYNQLGFLDLLRAGLSYDEIDLELTSRAVKRAGLREAVVEFGFPLALADRLRSEGVELTIDDGRGIGARRRAKSPTELAGIRRAQVAAQDAIATAAALLRQAEPVDGTLHLEGEPLLAERIRSEMSAVCAEHGSWLPPTVIVASVWQGTGHEPGGGPLPAGLPIEIDVWPQDERTSCWADMTRTFVAGGEPAAEVLRLERLARQALEQARESIRPGVLGRELHDMTCDVFEEAGYRTQRTGPGAHPSEGFQFSLGHGVGLRVHELPSLGQTGGEPLVVGDVLAIEPGLWSREVGGVRYEDLVLVTENGAETLTNYPYELTP
jgi:Xaa-Pro aminopeptidase